MQIKCEIKYIHSLLLYSHHEINKGGVAQIIVVLGYKILKYGTADRWKLFFLIILMEMETINYNDIFFYFLDKKM